MLSKLKKVLLVSSLTISILLLAYSIPSNALENEENCFDFLVVSYHGAPIVQMLEEDTGSPPSIKFGTLKYGQTFSIKEGLNGSNRFYLTIDDYDFLVNTLQGTTETKTIPQGTIYFIQATPRIGTEPFWYSRVGPGNYSVQYNCTDKLTDSFEFEFYKNALMSLEGQDAVIDFIKVKSSRENAFLPKKDFGTSELFVLTSEIVWGGMTRHKKGTVFYEKTLDEYEVVPEPPATGYTRVKYVACCKFFELPTPSPQPSPSPEPTPTPEPTKVVPSPFEIASPSPPGPAELVTPKIDKPPFRVDGMLASSLVILLIVVAIAFYFVFLKKRKVKK